MSEVVDWWHRESGKSLEASGLDARGGTGARANSEDRRAIITKIAGNCAFPFYLLPPPAPFLFLSLYRFFLSFRATSTTNELGINSFIRLYSLTISMGYTLTNKLVSL